MKVYLRMVEFLHNLWLRLRAAVTRRELDRDPAEELEFHLALRKLAKNLDPNAVAAIGAFPLLPTFPL